MSGGLILAAPASGSGKTTITLALLRAFSNAGVVATSAKIGPDYIDPGFHAAATGKPCFNLDSWAMSADTFAHLVRRCESGSELVIAEGVMGLFDGAANGQGSTADVAKKTGWPVILVVDAAGMAASAAALVHGFASYDRDLEIAGLIFNCIGGPGHASLLRQAVDGIGIPVFGCVPRNPALALPDRHLGLIQAREHPDLQHYLEATAQHVAAHVDMKQLLACARPSTRTASTDRPPIPPIGQNIAVAHDHAFAFSYPFVLDGWRSAGASVAMFSPLADETPAEDTDAVYLPGGYPELHACELAAARSFMDGLRAAARRGATIYGECGGYMVLGRGLVDTHGERHGMCDLLPVETSFENPGLTLGYRTLRTTADSPLGSRGTEYRGHEFHFASTLARDDGAHLFAAYDAQGHELGAAGIRSGSVMGSFIHLVDRVSD